VRSNQLERESRQARDELAELAHTATDYESLMQKKEAELSKLSSLLGSSRVERDSALKQAGQLQGRLDALGADLHVSETARKQGIEARGRLEEEIDELRSLLQAKASEETKRSEASKSMEQELSGLRTRITTIQQDAVDASREAADVQSKLKVELESLRREHKAAQDSYRDVKLQAQNAEKSLSETTLSLHAADKAKKAAETELHEFRSKHLDTEGQLAEALKNKEVSL
jgi:myosin protein heavy chain